MHLLAIASIYPIEVPSQLPGTLTLPLTLAKLLLGPQVLVRRWAVASLWLLLTAFSCWLPSSVHWTGTLLSFVFFRSRWMSCAQALCVSIPPKKTKEYSDWHSPTPTETNATYHASTRRSPVSVTTEVLDCGFDVNQFAPLLCCYVYFRTSTLQKT